MSDTTLKIEPTEVTPFFKLDSSEGMFEFRGRSLPEASQKFYYPILQRIETEFKSGTRSWTANFAFEYFNTSSSKCLFDILKQLARYVNMGGSIKINWCYEAYDEDMKETGEDYEDILGLRFNYVAI